LMIIEHGLDIFVGIISHGKTPQNLFLEK
jgi:hypothetical protein